MKNADFPIMTLLLFQAVVVTAKADTLTDLKEQAERPEMVSPYEDGQADKPKTEKKAPALIPAQLQAAMQSMQKQQEEKNWLLRGYEQQESERDKSDSSSNLYTEIASDKELAKLAGLPHLDTSLDNSLATQLPSGKPSLTLRTDDGSDPASMDISSQSTGVFKPLITPLSSTEAAGLHDFFSNPVLPANAPSNPPPAPETAKNDESLMDVPGLTAAQQGVPPSQLELTLDNPDQAPLDVQTHAEKFSLRAQPVASSSELLRVQNESLAPASVAQAGPPGTTSTQAVIPTVKPESESFVPMVPVTSSLRSHVADPHDFFAR